MAKPLDLTNLRFGRLIAIERIDPIKPRDGYRWLCICDCGNTCIRRTRMLRYDRHITKSCGCYVADLNKNKPKIRPSVNIKHGATSRGRTTEYKTWSSMIQRCNNPNNMSFNDYGGRGIEVCERWTLFENFLEDMGLKPSEKYSIERIDNSKGYFKENCRWANHKEQALNKRNNVLLIIDSKKMTAEEASIEYKIPERTLYRWFKEKKGEDLFPMVQKRLSKNR